MVEINAARGAYQLDEKPGLIDTYLAGDTFYSHFQIEWFKLQQ